MDETQDDLALISGGGLARREIQRRTASASSSAGAMTSLKPNKEMPRNCAGQMLIEIQIRRASAALSTENALKPNAAVSIAHLSRDETCGPDWQ